MRFLINCEGQERASRRRHSERAFPASSLAAIKGQSHEIINKLCCEGQERASRRRHSERAVPSGVSASSLAAIKGQSHEILNKFKDQESAAECPNRSFRGLLVALIEDLPVLEKT